MSGLHRRSKWQEGSSAILCPDHSFSCLGPVATLGYPPAYHIIMSSVTLAICISKETFEYYCILIIVSLFLFSLFCK